MLKICYMHVQNVKFYIIYLQIIFTEELFIRFFLTKIIYKKKKKSKSDRRKSYSLYGKKYCITCITLYNLKIKR